MYNYSANFAFLWDEITVPIKYGSDRQMARSLLERTVSGVTEEPTTRAKQQWPAMLDQYDLEEARLEPKVFLVANDNWLEYTLRYLTDYKFRSCSSNVRINQILRSEAKIGI